MKIKHLHLHNYRSIRDLELICPDLMVLLGPNNHGKSNILAALAFALLSDKPVAGDFFEFRGDERDMWVELTFGDLSQQERKTFEKYLNDSDEVTIRKTAAFALNGNIEVGYAGYIKEPTEWWLKASAVDRLSSRGEVEAAITEGENTSKPVLALQELLKASGRITKQNVLQFQDAYIAKHRSELQFERTLEAGPLLGRTNVAVGTLPDLYIVPAVRDLSDEVKVKTTTAFGRLLQRCIQEMTARDPRVAQLKTEFDGIVESFNPGAKGRSAELSAMEQAIAAELKPWGVDVTVEVQAPDLEKVFELGTELRVDDGHKTITEKKGHGLQRAVIFALLRAWANVLRTSSQTDSTTTVARKASDSIIFAIEEPELYLHPQAQRRLAASLRDIAQNRDQQVLLCTHSTHFVDLDQHRSLVLVSNPDAQVGTGVRQYVDELFPGDDRAARKERFHLASWVNPDRGELFFARKVVLVEGETETSLIPYLAERLSVFDSEVSLIDAGGKHNLPLYIALLNAFRIPYLVIHDEDPVAENCPPEKLESARRTFALNNEVGGLVDPLIGAVEVATPNLESMAGISHGQGEKKGKALAALDHFALLSNDAIPARLKTIVMEAYRDQRREQPPRAVAASNRA